MYDIKRIIEPKTIDEAISLYDAHKDLIVIAGGTDILIHLHHKKMVEAELLSLQKVAELSEIKMLDNGSISIGAMASFSKIFRSDMIKQHIPLLGEAAVSMGGPQIRNMATIGGNVCNGAVSADSAPTLFVLNALLRIVSKKGVRIVPIQEFYEGPGRVRLDKGEILTAIIITKENYHQMSGQYIKFSNRKAMDIAMLSVAVMCRVTGDQFDEVRIGLGVAAPTPIRCHDAEAYARGKTTDDETIKEIGRLAVTNARARNSWRGSKLFREHLIDVLTQRALKESIKRGKSQ